MRVWAFIGWMTFGAFYLGAQESDTSDQRKSEFKALPTAYYTPETSLAIEAFAYFKFYNRGADRASNIRLFTAYTLNRQVVIDLPWQIFTADENYRVIGKVDFRLFPEYFYGLGNDTKESNRSLYTYRSLGFRNSLQRKCTRFTYAGVFTEMRTLTATLPTVEFDASEMYDVRGDGGYRFVGVGPILTFDSRDFMLCPSQGAFLEARATMNWAEDEHGPLRFSKIFFDVRKYFSLDSHTILAGQFFTSSVLGDTPYRELPTLGGPLMHRGYYLGRLRDRHAFLTQVELRRDLFWRLGCAVFASAGRVYHDFDEPVLTDIRPAGGGGVRFRIGKHDNTNIRFDVAVTPDSHGFYVYFAEAF